ncbi:MAG: hypothetical protein NTZ59_10485, partial [Bacteroidetes bacterium]|nr:hypothetical protein [Bacteroidota bacterium]
MKELHTETIVLPTQTMPPTLQIKQQLYMKKGLLALLLLLCSFFGVNAQNPVYLNTGDYVGFTWNSISSSNILNAGSGNNTYPTTINQRIATPSGTGNKFFRFASATSSWTNYGPTSADQLITSGASPTTTANGGSVAYYLNIANASSNVVFNTNSGAPATAKFFAAEIQGTIRTISTVSQTPSISNGVNPGQTVTVTATLSGTLATGQGVYIRYTTNAFSTSTIAAASISGTTATFTIPSGTNTASAAVSYYIFTSGTSTPASTDADLMTINYNNNAGSNYSYTVGASANSKPYVSVGTGTGASPLAFNTAASWQGGLVPAASSSVIISANDTVLVSAAPTNTISATTVHGTLRSTFTTQTATTTFGTMTVSATGTYDHNMNGGAIPTATWTSGSPGATCLISGVTSTVPTVAQLAQSFYNFTVNSPITPSVNCTGNLQTINGNFNILSTGSAEFRLASSQTYTLNIGGSLNITDTLNLGNTSNGFTGTVNVAGDVNVTGAGCLLLGGSSSGSATININGTVSGTTGKLKINTTSGVAQTSSGSVTINTKGDFELTSGTFQFQNSSSGSKTYALNIGGNYNQTGGTFIGGSSSSIANVNFTGNSQTSVTYTQSGGTVTSSSIKTNYLVDSLRALTLNNDINVLASSTFTVKGGTLDLTTNNLTGAGTFTMTATALGAVPTLRIGSAAGIVSSVASATGSVQVTAARNFLSGANYSYTATSTANTNQVTGTGLPATVNTLTIANAGTTNNTVTLTNAGTTAISSTSVGSLTLTSGNLRLTNSTDTISIASGGGIAATSGNFSSASSGGIKFLGTGTVTGTVDFYPGVLQAPSSALGVTYSSGSTIRGNLQLNLNSFVNVTAPSYASGSTLIYNSGTTYGRSTEWSATSGAGYPFNVTLSN